MQFLKAVAFGTFALVSLAAAQSTVLAFTSTPASVTAGQGASLKWMAQSENEVCDSTTSNVDKLGLTRVRQ